MVAANFAHDALLEDVKVVVGQESGRALKVAVMGQTGTGKSSLLNALFNINLKTDPIRPCTTYVEPVTITDSQGHQLTFYDMPGIGESQNADKRYIQQYMEYLLNADVVLWTLHADIRSLTFDADSLSQILSQMSLEKQSQAISKIVFVLTKVDLLAPPAWMLGKIGNQARFVPVEEIQQLMLAKAEYCRAQLIEPYKDLMVLSTYVDGTEKIDEPHFIWDEYIVKYKGTITTNELTFYTRKYPQHRDLLTRLYQNYLVVPCSSRFKYNLSELLLMIVNRLGEGAIHRFANFYKREALSYLPYKLALDFANIFVYDRQNDRVLFDLRNIS
jgi:GTP-binding protein EngB required for normal cell division